MDADRLARLQNLIDGSDNIVFFGGAGVSIFVVGCVTVVVGVSGVGVVVGVSGVGVMVGVSSVFRMLTKVRTAVEPGVVGFASCETVTGV